MSSRDNAALAPAKTKPIVVGDRDTFTGPGRAGEGAKETYLRIFALLDVHAGTGTARIVGTERLP